MQQSVRTPIIRLHGAPPTPCSRNTRRMPETSSEFLSIPETRVDTPPPGRRMMSGRRSSSVPSRRSPQFSNLTDPELVVNSSRYLSQREREVQVTKTSQRMASFSPGSGRRKRAVTELQQVFPVTESRMRKSPTQLQGIFHSEPSHDHSVHLPDPLTNVCRSTDAPTKQKHARQNGRIKNQIRPMTSISSSEEDELQAIWSTPELQRRLRDGSSRPPSGESERRLTKMLSSDSTSSEMTPENFDINERVSSPEATRDGQTKMTARNTRDGKVAKATQVSLQDIRKLEIGSSSESLNSDEFPLDTKPPSYSSDSIEVSPILSKTTMV